jgi:hypothetical protein
MAQDNRIMDWNDTIQDDGREFIILPEGDYYFTVTDFERARFPGSAKIPACNKATLSLDIDNDKGIATARVDLILYRTLEWRIASFFRSIGMKKHGEQVVMDWTKVVGARGKAHIKPRSYTGKNGEERQANNVENFIDCDDPKGLVETKDPELPWGNSGF